jgi:hypothetical protein
LSCTAGGSWRQSGRWVFCIFLFDQGKAYTQENTYRYICIHIAFPELWYWEWCRAWLLIQFWDAIPEET